jgi:hypothetical protein
VSAQPTLEGLTKRCSLCHEEKPFDAFYFDSHHDRYESRCKECQKLSVAERARKKNTVKAREKYRRNPEPQRRRQRRSDCLRKYGITLEHYEQMFADQRGVCAICGLPPEPNRRLAVDHCHATGAVRGLLHSGCNLALGNLRDDPVLLRAAADYLERRA